MKRILIVTSSAAALASALPVAAQQRTMPPQQQAIDHEKQAFAFAVQECTESKVKAFAGVFTLQAQVEDLKVKLAAETKRADEAEAKAKPPAGN